MAEPAAPLQRSHNGHTLAEATEFQLWDPHRCSCRGPVRPKVVQTLHVPNLWPNSCRLVTHGRLHLFISTSGWIQRISFLVKMSQLMASQGPQSLGPEAASGKFVFKSSKLEQPFFFFLPLQRYRSVDETGRLN